MPDRPAVPPPPAEDAPLQDWTAHLLALQAPACEILGSTLYARLLRHSAEDVRAGGAVWQALEPHATRDVGAALALRFMAAMHRLVLERRAPELAVFYPSVGGTGDPTAAWPAFLSTVAANVDTLRVLVGLPCQTNEVGRCAALAPGFLEVARRTARPLRLLEIGASAGLNLRWDRYHYADRDDGRRWGHAASPVQVTGHWEVPPALLDVTVAVSERRGCDPRPIDPTSDAGRLALTSAVWADQRHRFERLRGALEVAARVLAPVDQAPASQWLPPQLTQPARGAATVVYHSVVLQYMTAEERASVVGAIASAGARATHDAPLFWLRMEPERPLRAMSVRLTAWPGGEEVLLATAGAHGDPVRWRA